jgi:hypothetical protein
MGMMKSTGPDIELRVDEIMDPQGQGGWVGL